MSDNTVMPVARVAVLADTRLVDVVLPTELPLREIMPAVHRLTAAGGIGGGTAQPMSLGPVGGAPYSLDATLDTVGVVDGDLLVLQPVLAGPAAPGIIEDVADAAVIFSESRRNPWDIAHIRLAARLAVLAVVAIATAFLVAYHIAGGTAAILGIVGIAAVGVGGALFAGASSAKVARDLSVVVLAPIAAAFYFAIPGDDWAPHVMLAAAAVSAWALIWMLLRDSAIAWFTGVFVVGVGGLLAAAAAILWDLTPVRLGCGLILFALLITVRAAQLSAAWARLPMPAIPAPGDPAPSPLSLHTLRDLPRRVRVSDAHQTGFVGGSVVLSVVGSIAVAADSPGTWAWYVIIAAAAGAVLRARVWDSAPCKAWLLAHPYLLATALLVGFTVAGRYVAAAVALGVLAVLAAAWVIVALNPRVGDPDTYSLPMGRAVGLVAAAIDASLIPVMAHVVGIFDWVLTR